jgi:hypothetical protein
MLRYRVAYDPERGHFVLPSLAAVVPPAETFASRAAAQKIARGRNARPAEPSFEPLEDSRFLRTFLRRASA